MVGKADDVEGCRRKVRERIEAAHPLEQHHTTGSDSGAQIGCLEEEGLERFGECHLRFKCFNMCDIRLDRQHLIMTFSSVTSR
jgi:hypothetical protein